MNIKWHYWCGTKNHPERYIKYLLISVDSLINIGKIKPEDIYVTIEEDLLESLYGLYIKKLGINVLTAPAYRNYSKQISYHKLIKQFPNIDKLVQIDCDTLVTDRNILEKISDLTGCLNIDVIPDINMYDTIQRRDGQKQTNNTIFSIGTENINPPHSNTNIQKYNAFKDYCCLIHNLDLESFIQYSKTELLPVGFAYVLSPKNLPFNFFEFLSSLNFFFEDDEMGLIMAKFMFNLKYEDLNKNKINKYSDENIKFQAKTTIDFEKYKGIVHFPTKDDLIDQETTERANRILGKTLL